MAERTIRIGSVTGVNPARRELRVKPLRGRMRDLEGADWIRIEFEDAQTMRCRVLKSRPGGPGVIVALAPGVTRDNVARMKGASVVVPESEHRARPDLEFDPSEVTGMDVYTEDDTLIGTVVDAYETGANDVLEIEKPDGGRILLPAIEHVIARIDWERHAFVVRDIAPYAVEDTGDVPTGGP